MAGKAPQRLRGPGAEGTEQLGRVIVRLGRLVEHALAQVDLTLRQYHVLTTLADGPSSPSVLAEGLYVANPSMTRIARALVERGYVTAATDPTDRRRITLSLTSAGRQVVAEGNRSLHRNLADTLGELTPDEVAAAGAGMLVWNDAMTRIWRRLHQPNGATGSSRSGSPYTSIAG